MAEFKKKILVIEDDVAIREVLSLILNDSGYHVIEVDPRKNVEKYLLLHKPALLVVDLHYPGIDIISLVRRLKSAKNTRNYPVLILSADDHIDIFTKKARANGYLKKPFTIEELLETVERQLS